MAARKRKSGDGIGGQRVEPKERSDDNGHNQSEKDEHKLAPHRFIVPAHDLRGHSEKIHLSIQPVHLRALGDIAADPRTPFKQPQDVVRHAIVREIRYLHAVMPGMKTHFYAMLNFGIDLSSRSEISESMDVLFMRMDEMIARLRQGGYYEEANKQVSFVFSVARSLDESEYKEDLLRRFRQKYRGGGE